MVEGTRRSGDVISCLHMFIVVKTSSVTPRLLIDTDELRLHQLSHVVGTGPILVQASEPHSPRA